MKTGLRAQLSRLRGGQPFANGGAVTKDTLVDDRADMTAAPSDKPPQRRMRNMMIGKLRQQWGWDCDLRIRLVKDSGMAFKDARLSRDGNDFVVEMDRSMRNVLGTDGVAYRIMIYLLQFREAHEAETMVVTLTDGEFPGTYRFSPSTASDHVHPIVDPYFFRYRGYEEAEADYADAPAWDDRDDQLSWRGGLNGIGTITWDRSMVDAGGLMPRCRLALKCAGSEIDAGLVVGPDHAFARYAPFLEKAGMIAPYKVQKSWLNHRYALDIDGQTNAWNNFFNRLKYGCCVLKVDSEQGYRQWYYDRLTPWEHYVPVKSDLSDLFEQYDWVRSNPSRAKEIAAAGRQVVAAMTFDGERAEGARIIAENWNG